MPNRLTPRTIDKRLQRMRELGLVAAFASQLEDGRRRWRVSTIAGDRREGLTLSEAGAYADGLAHGAWARDRDPRRMLEAIVASGTRGPAVYRLDLLQHVLATAHTLAEQHQGEGPVEAWALLERTAATMQAQHREQARQDALAAADAGATQ